MFYQNLSLDVEIIYNKITLCYIAINFSFVTLISVFLLTILYHFNSSFVLIQLKMMIYAGSFPLFITTNPNACHFVSFCLYLISFLPCVVRFILVTIVEWKQIACFWNKTTLIVAMFKIQKEKEVKTNGSRKFHILSLKQFLLI